MSLPPLQVGLGTGELALSFVSTASPRAPSDPFATGESLVGWMRDVGILPLAEEDERIGNARDAPREPRLLASPSERRILHFEARALRTALLSLFRAIAAEKAPSEPVLFAVNRVLAGGVSSLRLEHSENGLRCVESEAPSDVIGWLAPVARSALELVTTVDPSRLRGCAAPGCGVWFVDVSRGGRRRWCSMEECGNRQKAARHRRRRAGR